MPDPSSIEDQAVRYLLGELEGIEKTDFEARLAGSAELRALLHDLEAASDALALTAPLRRPPARVWQRIALEIQSAPNSTAPATARPAIHWVDLVRSWIGRAGWAVATVVAFLWALRVPLPTSSQAPGTTSAARSESAQPGEAAGPIVVASQNSSSRRPPAGNTASNGASSISPDSKHTEELLYLRQRIRELSALNQSLAQQYALPPGAARFQVFRLTASNSPFSSPLPVPSSSLVDGVNEDTAASASDAATLQNLLTHALARELAAVPAPLSANPSGGPSVPNSAQNTSKTAESVSKPPATSDSNATTSDQGLSANTPQTPESNESTPSTPADNSANSQSPAFAVVDLPTGNANTSDSASLAPPTGIVSRAADNTPSTPADTAASTPSALGVYSPETGVGSIAFVTAGDLPTGHAYQFWVVNNQSISAISLGTTTQSAERILVHFSLDPNLVFSPGFLVTIEPEGGSAFPSGPIVVAPPTPVAPTPSP